MAGKTEIRGLIKEAFKHMVIKESFEKVTVSQLCMQANISRKTFYSYFDDKYAVLDEVIYDDTMAYCERVLPLLSSTSAFPTGPASSIMLNEQMLLSILNNRDFYLSLTAKGSGRAFARALQKSSIRLHRTLAEMHGGVFDDKMRYACRFGAGAQAAVVIEWLRDGMTTSPHELAIWLHEWSFNCSCVGFDYQCSALEHEEIPSPPFENTRKVCSSGKHMSPRP